MKHPLILLALMSLLTGCSTTSGLAPTSTRSGFDNARIVNIEPHGNGGAWDAIPTGLGAQWRSNDPDNVILIVAVFNDYTGITGAELSIDGERVVLQKIGNATDMAYYSGTRFSTNEFATPLSTVERILKSKRTWLRIYTPTGTLESPVIDGPTDSKAYHALERFMAAVKSG